MDVDGTTNVGVADVLERAAALIESTPGTNALDANREAIAGLIAAGQIGGNGDVDRLAADTYYALLEYLPPHVDMVGPWSDSETADRVAGKMRQCAKTIRRGGPAHVDATVPAAALADVVDIPTTRNAGTDHHMTPVRRGPGERAYTPLTALQHERGIVQSAIIRAQKAKHPNAAKLTANEIRLAELDREIAAMEAGQPATANGATG